MKEYEVNKPLHEKLLVLCVRFVVSVHVAKPLCISKVKV